ncbi:hypothetical protein V8C44DRAFT_327224, partial [Trichoderma aethiopicum]
MGVMNRGDVGFVSSRLFASSASASLSTQGAMTIAFKGQWVMRVRRQEVPVCVKRLC